MLEKNIYYGNKKIKIFYLDFCPVTSYSTFLLENFPNVRNLTIADYGIGSGILSIIASIEGANKIYGIDKNRKTFKIVHNNCAYNQVENIQLFLNKLNIKSYIKKESLDMIISNPAGLPSPITLPIFFDSGKLGNDMIFELTDFAEFSLKKKGVLFFLQSSLVPKSLTESFLRDLKFSYKIISKKRMRFRKFYFQLLPYFKKLKKKYQDIDYFIINDEYFEEVYLYKAIKNI